MDFAFTPEQDAITRSRLSVGLLYLLENLEPEQRIVFVLREVFEYSYNDIAEIAGKSEAACRQLGPEELEASYWADSKVKEKRGQEFFEKPVELIDQIDKMDQGGLSLGRAQWPSCAHPPPRSLSCN